MSYHQGNHRRTVDRRVYSDPRHDGPERRKPSREPRSKIGLFGAAIAVLIVADPSLWHGEYRHAAFSSLHARADAVRQWSAHVWDVG